MMNVNAKNFIDVIKSQLVFNLKTGNVIFDTLITTIFISLLGFLFNNINYSDIFDKTYHYIFRLRRKNIITVESYSRNGKTIFPYTFISIIHYIKNNIKSLDIKELTGICMNVDGQHTFYSKDFHFIPSINYEFEIYSHIFCSIYQSDDEQTIDADTEKVVHRKMYIIKLWSTEKELNDIYSFIDTCTIQYTKFTDEQNRIQKFFKFQNSESDGYVNFKVTQYHTNRSFDTVYFDEKDKFVKNLDFFINNKSWFEKKNCPYHMGILLFGKPGCGKTSFIKSLISYTKRHVIYLNLNNIKTCSELENVFFKQVEVNNSTKTIDHSEYIFVLEDIDCLTTVIHDRNKINNDNVNGFSNDKNAIKQLASIVNMMNGSHSSDDNELSSMLNKNSDELNLSFILNLIDGIVEMPGRIIVMTTNHPELIDPALTRPGRIDFKIEMKLASHNTILGIINHYYDIPIIDNELLNKIYQIKEYYYSPADISDMIKACFFEQKSVNECIDYLISNLI